MDHFGSINSIADTSGNVHWSYRYDPFGTRTTIYTLHSLAPTDRSYTRHWSFKPSKAAHAAAKELYLTCYRIYDPVHGRWSSRDPIGEASGVNLYGYVGNGPVNQMDPLGLQQLGDHNVDDWNSARSMHNPDFVDDFERDLASAVRAVGETIAGCANVGGKLFTVLKFKKKIPKINGRTPVNSKYAGKAHPSGVKFNDQGFPNFRPYAKAEVKVKNLTGDRRIDNKLANEAAGFDKTPDGCVWHHVEDGKTMQLVPRAIHDAVGNTGGAAVIKNGGKFD